MMTLHPANFNSSMELPSTLERLIDMQRGGADVRREIAACILYANEMPCESAEDAMVLIEVARVLYGHSIEYAVLGHAATLELMMEADALINRTVAFFERETGERLPTQFDLRGRLH